MKYALNFFLIGICSQAWSEVRPISSPPTTSPTMTIAGCLQTGTTGDKLKANCSTAQDAVVGTGGLLVNGQAIVAGTSTLYGLGIVSNKAPTAAVLSVSSQNAAGLLTILGNGKIGIGTTSPATLLNMSSGTLTVDGNVYPQLSLGGAVLNGDNSGSFTVSAASLTVSGAIVVNTAQNAFQLGGFGTQFLNLSSNYNGSLLLGSNLGFANFNSQQFVTPKTHGSLSGSGIALAGVSLATMGLAGNDVGIFTTPIVATTATDNYDATNPRLIIKADGNIGIGTASPATKLDVNGNAQFGSGATKSTFTATGDLYSAGAVRPASAIISVLQAKIPAGLGSMWFCTDCAPPKMVVSTGTNAGNYSDLVGLEFK